MLNRRDVLKAGVGSLGLTGAAAAEDGTGPFDQPTAKFDVKKTTLVPNWAFRKLLPIPPVPRPTAVGTYEELTRDGAMPFGATDPVPIGCCFHGVAREWGETPEHWRAYGLDPVLSGVDSWNDKKRCFGKFYSHENPADRSKDIANWGHFPIKCYKVPMLELEKCLANHDLPARLYGYAGIVPGPMHAFRLGQPVVIRYENHLETEVSIHLHGGHSPSHSDGFPTFYVLQGKARDYFYPNIIPLKKVTSEPRGTSAPVNDAAAQEFLKQEQQWFREIAQEATRQGHAVTHQVDMGEAQSSVWYHDHATDATGYNVAKGLAGVARYFGERELRLIHDGVLPGLREKSCFDPDLHQLVEREEVEDPDNPGYYKPGKEPYHNPYDIYMVLQDRVIDAATGQVSYNSDAHNGYLGDIVLVNGEAYPFLNVENRKYRFRFLDGSNSRIYRLRLLSEENYFRAQRFGVGAAAEGVVGDGEAAASVLSDYDLISEPFLRIGKDSWLWSKPLPRKSVTIAMANRADLIVDFPALASDLGAGEERVFYVVNTMPQTDGRGPKQPLADGGDPRVLPLPFDTVASPDGAIPATSVAELPRPMPLMKIIVRGRPVPKEQDASINVDTCLNPHDAILDDEVQVVREFVFQRGRGAWMINSRFYDPTISNVNPTLGTVEEWVLKNGGGGWWHPIHIHLESHQLVRYEKSFDADAIVDAADPPAQLPVGGFVDVTGEIPGEEVRGLHDTQILGPNTVARIRMRFRTWNGPFVFHCHNVEHEDMRMMFNFEPVPWREILNRATEELERSRGEDRRDANGYPDARTHGDDVTLQPSGTDSDEPRKIGELPWEMHPVPRTPAAEAPGPFIPKRSAGDTDVKEGAKQ